MQVVMARLDDMEEAMGGLSVRCRRYDNVLTMVGALQQQVERLEVERNSKVETIQHQQQTTTELQQKVERLEGERNNQMQRQQQIIKSKEQEIHALKNELAAVHRLLNEG